MSRTAIVQVEIEMQNSINDRTLTNEEVERCIKTMDATFKSNMFNAEIISSTIRYAGVTI